MHDEQAPEVVNEDTDYLGVRDGGIAEPSRGGSARRAASGRRGQRPPVRSRRGRGCAIAAVVMLALLAIGAGAVWWTLFRAQTDIQPGGPVQLHVPKGASTADIGRLLAHRGVIANPLMFRLRARMTQDAGPLKAGVYDLTTGTDYDQALAILRAGPPPILYYTLAIPEGWTITQIADRVEKVTGISAVEFSKLARTGAASFPYPFLEDNKTRSLEGYLFPKTYRIKEGSTARDIIDAMLTQFDKEIEGLDISYATARGLSMHDVVTLASMIERETRTAKDRRLASSVIYNRLSRGMRLEIDATVQYLVGNKRRLLYRDLGVKSPYNTYLHTGLPPGPIASPGLPSLEAAAHPARTEYLFYVLTGRDGSHSFAKTSEEFLRLKEQARRGLK